MTEKILYEFNYESESHSVVSNSLRPHGLYSSWNSPGQNIGGGGLSLLQGIFPTQGSNPGLLHRRQILYQLSFEGSLNLTTVGWLTGFPGGTNGKEPTCQCRRQETGFDPWVRKIPWRRAWQPTQVLLPGESHGQGGLVGYGPWGHKESDTTEATWPTCTLNNSPPKMSMP